MQESAEVKMETVSDGEAVLLGRREDEGRWKGRKKGATIIKGEHGSWNADYLGED